MNFVFQPWQLLLIIVAGWLNRHQAAAIEYLHTENQVLKESHRISHMLPRAMAWLSTIRAGRHFGLGSRAMVEF